MAGERSRVAGNIRGQLLVLLAFGITLYFVVAFGQQAWKARQLEAQVAERRQALAALQREHDQLAAELERYATGDYQTYVEQTARRELNLAYPGETVGIVRWHAAPTPTPQATPSGQRPESKPNWRRWLDVLRLPQP
ncbi:Cell division protein FtsB [bacterium HR26]|nr:Cell division protein FtsB [bacterium HR26]